MGVTAGWCDTPSTKVEGFSSARAPSSDLPGVRRNYSDDSEILCFVRCIFYEVDSHLNARYAVFKEPSASALTRKRVSFASLGEILVCLREE